MSMPANLIRLLLHERRLRERIRTDCEGSDPLRGVDVLFHQQRRYRQHFADVVESKDRVVGGELFAGWKRTPIQRRESCSGILYAVEPASQHALPHRASFKRSAASNDFSDEFHEGCHAFSCGGCGAPFGGISPVRSFETMRSQPPRLVSIEAGSLKRSHLQAARRHLVVVAHRAVFLRTGCTVC